MYIYIYTPMIALVLPTPHRKQPPPLTPSNGSREAAAPSVSGRVHPSIPRASLVVQRGTGMPLPLLWLCLKVIYIYIYLF